MRISIYKLKKKPQGAFYSYESYLNTNWLYPNYKFVKLKNSSNDYEFSGRIYYKKYDSQPAWVTDLTYSNNPNLNFFNTKSVTALLIIKISSSTSFEQNYAISLSGNGYNLLDQSKVVSDFGHQIVNTINDSNYRTISSSDFSNSTTKKISSTNSSLLNQFDFNDIITSFTTSSSKLMNRELKFSGGIPLTLNLPKSENLIDLLLAINELEINSNAESIITLLTPTEIETSNSKLTSTFADLRTKSISSPLTNNNFKKISFLNIYELESIQVHNSSGFKFNLTEDTLDTFFNKLFRKLGDFDGDILDIRVTLNYNDNSQEGRLKDFLEYSYTLNGITYFYSSMTWRKIEKSYVDIMISEISQLRQFSSCQLLNLPMRDDEPKKYIVEGYYNYLQGEEEGFYNFDQSSTKTKNPKGYKSIEICDLLYKDDENCKNYFFHVKDKDGGNSQSFTYLMNQIYSSTLFILDTNKPFKKTTFTKLSSGKKYFGEGFDFDEYKTACSSKIEPLRDLLINKENMVVVMAFMAYENVDLTSQSINVIVPLYELIINLKRLGVELEYITLTP